MPQEALDELSLRVDLAEDVFPENPSCRYVDDGVVTVKLYSRRDLLAEAYARPTSIPAGAPAGPVFDGPLVVAGQPGARLVDSAAGGGRDCTVVIGLTDSSGLEIDGLRYGCAEVEKFADAVVTALGRR